MKRQEEWIERLFYLLSDDVPSRFDGVGLVVYHPPMTLPVTPLVPVARMPANEAVDVMGSAEFLRKIANSSENLHDGFHLVDAERLVITHVCQYVAPPIPSIMPNHALPYPVGARYMTALLASLLPSVVLAATLNAREGAVLFVNGDLRRVDIDSLAR